MVTEHPADDEIGPRICRACWNGWHEDCELSWCECDCGGKADYNDASRHDDE